MINIARTFSDDVTEVAATQAACTAELQRRGWDYLRRVGYDPYHGASRAIMVSVNNRNGIDVVHITASFEQSWKPVTVDMEIPATVFNDVVRDNND